MAFLLVVVESVWQLCFSILHPTTSLRSISKLSLGSRGVRSQWSGQAGGGLQEGCRPGPPWKAGSQETLSQADSRFCGQARPAAASVLSLFMLPSIENSFLKLGITWFQGPAVKISRRPASTFHSQPCLRQAWVPLAQFLQ